MKDRNYYGIQIYQDYPDDKVPEFCRCWWNTPYKTLEEVELAHKQFGCNKLKHIYLRDSWFEQNIYYYIDTMGHTVLFRCITNMYKDVFDNAQSAGVTKKAGNVEISFRKPRLKVKDA